MTENSIQPEELVNDAKEAAREAKKSPLVDRLTRLGYVTRGVIYTGIAILAGQMALTGRGELEDQRGVLTHIAQQPFGKLVVILLALGFAGLALWGVVRALADPYRKGSGIKGIFARAGYLVTGISYSAMLYPAFRLMRYPFSREADASQQAEEVTAGLLGYAWGPWLVGAVGVGLIIIGLARVYGGLRGKLSERLKGYEMTEDERRLAQTAGRLGYIAFGIVMATIGALAVLAATTLDPKKVGGLDRALDFLRLQPYGPWILGLVALGLLAYAVYSFMGAMWFRIKEL